MTRYSKTVFRVAHLNLWDMPRNQTRILKVELEMQMKKKINHIAVTRKFFSESLIRSNKHRFKIDFTSSDSLYKI